jgi:hypothetical protein
VPETGIGGLEAVLIAMGWVIVYCSPLAYVNVISGQRPGSVLIQIEVA